MQNKQSGLQTTTNTHHRRRGTFYESHLTFCDRCCIIKQVTLESTHSQDSYTCAGAQKWSLCFVWRTWKIANQTWNMESGGRICIPSLLSSELQIHEELPLRQSNAAEISVVDVNWILGLNLGFFAVIFSFICFDFLCKTLHTERAPRKDPLREQQVPLSIKHNTKRL